MVVVPRRSSLPKAAPTPQERWASGQRCRARPSRGSQARSTWSSHPGDRRRSGDRIVRGRFRLAVVAAAERLGIASHSRDLAAGVRAYRGAHHPTSLHGAAGDDDLAGGDGLDHRLGGGSHDDLVAGDEDGDTVDGSAGARPAVREAQAPTSSGPDPAPRPARWRAQAATPATAGRAGSHVDTAVARRSGPASRSGRAGRTGRPASPRRRLARRFGLVDHGVVG